MNQRRQSAFRLISMTVIAGFIILLAGSPVLRFYTALAAGSLSINAPAQGQALNNPVVVVSGTADANAAVKVFLDNVLAGTTAADVYGIWSYQTPALAEVAHEVYAMTYGTEGETIASNTVNFDIDLTPPTVNIVTPVENAYINFPVIEGTTEPLAQVTVMVYGTENTVTADLLGEWMAFFPDLPEGSHTITASAVDRAGNQGEAAYESFTLDTTRPVTMPDIFPGEDMTTVPVDIAPSVSILEMSPIDPAILQSALILTERSSDSVSNSVPGTVYSSVYTDVYGGNYYGLRFIPDAPLRLSARYEVGVNPLVCDAAGNPVIPRSWTFTTVSDVYNENPHGNYFENVNTCANCHSPHLAVDGSLIRPMSDAPSLDNYCNACHDGTAAPEVYNWSGTNLHNFQISTDGVRGSSSCAACHNPHLTWVPENPNLLQDYYFYQHNDPTNPYLPDSSEERLCESCHEAAVKDRPEVSYIRYRYNKHSVTQGTPEDYSLCLNCHDGSQAVNVAVYYSGPSGHFLTPLDASPINGYMPCADCHEAHGSDNIKQLKSELGHNHEQAFTAGGLWDSAAERSFCLSCHNGVTELYGITVQFDGTVPGHESTNTDSCSRCHGGSPSAAAHAPSVAR